jgi:glycosyltransferase involved in cell wall biosynthesis
MKLLVITHVEHGSSELGYFAYAPYVKEMNLWGTTVDELLVVAPLQLQACTAITDFYITKKIKLIQVPAFSLVGSYAILKTILQLPSLLLTIFKAMASADHIHLRCPGNMGLLGCLVQIFFPNKPKTAKYAGNWDPQSKQPWSYRLQKWILNNTFLTRNMTVLVYGHWQGTSKNCRSFFTASYSETAIQPMQQRPLHSTIRALFVGTLSAGKQPLYAIQWAEALLAKGCPIQLELYGEGAERNKLQTYIASHQLRDFVQLKGNQTREELIQAYQNSHFLVLPSVSEGWPKAVAEAMFWGCVPVALPVSCVPEMLNQGNRGILLSGNLAEDVEQLQSLLQVPQEYQAKAQQAMQWSQQYTLERMADEIKQLLHA